MGCWCRRKHEDRCKWHHMVMVTKKGLAVEKIRINEKGFVVEKIRINKKGLVVVNEQRENMGNSVQSGGCYQGLIADKIGF